jgi:hypothetical protein
MRAFLKDLRRKLEAKQHLWPDESFLEGFEEIVSFRHYDDRYTAPLHGFRDAAHYWESCSATRFIPHIQVPTLVVNSLDDPFLGEKSFPYEIASASHHVFLETPRFGGHLGFMPPSKEPFYWSERRALTFLEGTDTAERMT